MSESKNNTDKKKKNVEPLLYYDTNKSKGNTFEKNINLINRMYFGQGINITDNPFVTLSEKDQNKYLSVQCFRIKTKDKAVIKEVFIPGSFLQLVFNYENLLFHITPENKLLVLKLNKDSYQMLLFQDKKIEMNETIKDEKCVNAIKEKLKELNKEIALSKKYEILFDIFKNEIKYSLGHKTPKKITKCFEICLEEKNENSANKNEKIDKEMEKEEENLNEKTKYIIEIESTFDPQIDEFGILKEKIKLCKGEISFEDGIKHLKSYIKDQNDKNDGNKNEINFISNDFKCPIIYKNFQDEIIKQGDSILFEIKSGFALKDVIEQLEKRIKIINNCIFVNYEKRPVFYIGLVNILSDNIDKEIPNIMKNFNLKANLLLVVSVDYKYCDIDVSSEIHGEYLLYKKINSLEQKMNSNFIDLGKKIDNDKDEIKNEINQKLDNLQFQVQSLINFMQGNYPNFQLPSRNGIGSKKIKDKNDN